MLLVVFLACLATISGVHEVFSKGEAGHFCIKIPYLIQAANGTILALAEGRRGSCSDYAWTQLVYKKSYDGGKSWSKLLILHSEGTLNESITIGNAVPVVINTSNPNAPNARLLMPFCRNNLEIFVMYSDDHGESWSTPVQIYGITLPEWKFMGLGPPGGLQLSTGRILLPGYAANCTVTCNNGDQSSGFSMLSDDYGKTWYRSPLFGGSIKARFPNEAQAVELPNGDIMMNARGELIDRLITISTNGGATWGETFAEKSLPNSFAGCQGSTVIKDGHIFYSDPSDNPIRQNMRLFHSNASGPPFNFEDLGVINKSYSAYSSLYFLQNGSLAAFYETADKWKLIFEPDHTYFNILDDLTRRVLA